VQRCRSLVSAGIERLGGHTYSNVFCCRLKHRELSQSNLGQWGYDKEKERDKHIQGNIEVYM